MQIGPYKLRNNLVVAPMAGVTDRPFRMLCKKLGAGYAVSEMVTSNSLLYGSAKTLRRANHEGEVEPISVQIAGADPKMLAEAAKYNVDHGAQIIDINMGCPAKKICNVMAGSALLKDEPLVSQILKAVVNAVDVPVTLKIRTGWDKHNRNAVTVAKMAEELGVQALAIHGRTRACAYMGDAEYDTIAEVKQAIQEKIKTKSFKEWHEIFANLDVCVEPVLSLSEALNSPLAQQRGWIVDVPLQNNTTDTEPQIACPIKFSRSQMRYSFVGQKLGEGQW